MDLKPQANKSAAFLKTGFLNAGDPYRWVGAFFFLWAAYNSYLDVSRYGVGWGLYWWFCNLATFSIGIGLFFRLRDLLTAFLAIALFTQVFWIIDNTHKVMTGQILFGLVGSMYQPGLPLDEFISVHYHYFTIPVALLALFHLPVSKKPKTLLYIATINPFIFAVSYFVFPPNQNINCIHAPCFPGLDWKGPLYSLSFWSILFAVHCFFAWGLDEFFKREILVRRFLPSAKAALALLMVASVAVSAKDVQYKLALPSFSCQNSPASSELELKCDFTRDDSEGHFLLAYSAHNPGRETLVCDIFLREGEKTERVLEKLALEPGGSSQMLASFPNPDRTVAAQLEAACTPYQP